LPALAPDQKKDQLKKIKPAEKRISQIIKKE